MADIKMCIAETCPMRKKCLRFMATPDKENQEAADFMSECNAETTYRYFLSWGGKK